MPSGFKPALHRHHTKANTKGILCRMENTNGNLCNREQDLCTRLITRQLTTVDGNHS